MTTPTSSVPAGPGPAPGPPAPPAAPAAAAATAWALPRGVLIMVALAATTITVAGLREVAGILGPVLLALVLSIATVPLSRALARRGLPQWVGTTLSILAVYVGLLLLCGSLLVAGARFATLVPTYQAELNSVVDGATSRLAELGVGSAQTQAVLDSFDLSRLAGLVTGLLGSILSLVTSLVFIVTLVLFICLDAGSFGRHLDRIRDSRPAFVRAVESFADGTRTYLLVSTAFGLLVAVIDIAVLVVLGVPAALLWGLLAFITNYIPNIGFLLGLAPPAVLALLEGGPILSLEVIAAYCVVNVIIQSVIQPKMVGDAVGLSASVTFLSLVVWAWILGPLGAVLAVPLSLLARALLIDVDPTTQWMAGLIGTAAPDRDRVEDPPAADDDAPTPAPPTTDAREERPSR